MKTKKQIKESNKNINPLKEAEDVNQLKTKVTWDRARTVNYNNEELLVNTYSCTSCKGIYKFEEIIHSFCPFCGTEYQFTLDVSF